MTKERIARDIVGYEGLYSIDIFGNVFNSKGVEMKQRLNEIGYLTIGLSKNNRRKLWKVHRLVALTFIPNPQNKTQVNHIDGNKTNNVVWNLEWVTPKENTHHAIATGLRHDEMRDLTVQKFNNLTVKKYIKDIRQSGALRHLYECQCDCGNIVNVTDNNLITGSTKSCGCLKEINRWKKN